MNFDSNFRSSGYHRELLRKDLEKTLPLSEETVIEEERNQQDTSDGTDKLEDELSFSKTMSFPSRSTSDEIFETSEMSTSGVTNDSNIDNYKNSSSSRLIIGQKRSSPESTRASLNESIETPKKATPRNKKRVDPDKIEHLRKSKATFIISFCRNKFKDRLDTLSNDLKGDFSKMKKLYIILEKLVNPLLIQRHGIYILKDLIKNKFTDFYAKCLLYYYDNRDNEKCPKGIKENIDNIKEMLGLIFINYERLTWKYIVCDFIEINELEYKYRRFLETKDSEPHYRDVDTTFVDLVNLKKSKGSKKGFSLTKKEINYEKFIQKYEEEKRQFKAYHLNCNLSDVNKQCKTIYASKIIQKQVSSGPSEENKKDIFVWDCIEFKTHNFAEHQNTEDVLENLSTRGRIDEENVSSYFEWDDKRDEISDIGNFKHNLPN
mmetsp:Transcript_13199/g.13795  ORF Transcript_13199/g.13795 Transcript_13199/m.13795 type:complete len:433 (+) Transcript_13199:28-1326(+)